VADAAVEEMPVEGALELGAVEFLTGVKGWRTLLALSGASRRMERVATPFFCRFASV
jgi:hypothetical protein